MSGLNLTPDQLRQYVLDVCAALGSEPTEASLVADQLIGANMTGHDSHGIGMMPSYVRSVDAGLLFPNRHASVASDSGSVLVIDGNRAFGQVSGFEATNMAIEKARETGVALAGLRNSFHIGRIGHWGEQCARAGMASIHFVNVAGHTPLVAPYGGSEARFTTNPICIAIPSSGEKPAALLDMATSTIAMGKARVAKNKGVPVPPNTIVDGAGDLTTDPSCLFDEPREGALIAFGDHKGSGLAIMCEILGAALTGGMTAAPKNERDGSALNSMLSIVINPDALAGTNVLLDETTAFLDYVRTARLRTGFDEILLPGEPEQRAREARASQVPVDDGTLTELRKAATTAGLDDAHVDSLLS